MNRYLARALCSPQDPWIADAFYEDFQTSGQWRLFFNENFPEQDILPILEMPRGWRASDFQALYVACWAYKPVVKGSYMLKLPDHVHGTVRHGYEKLDTRWTSHLHKKNNGGVGSPGWRFLRGYHELLVQLEEANDGLYLFLKCEGFPAISIPHIKSYLHKKRHGVGLDVNEELLTLSSDEDRHLGIKVRRAENYSPHYKELMKRLARETLKSQGEVVDVRQAAALMAKHAKFIAVACWGANLTTWLAQQLQPFGVPHQGEIRNDQFANLPAASVASVLEILLDFTERAIASLGNRALQYPVLGLIRQAAPDIRSVARELRKDQERGNTHTVRYFEEVVVTPEQVNRGLQKAHELLSMGKEQLTAMIGD